LQQQYQAALDAKDQEVRLHQNGNRVDNIEYVEQQLYDVIQYQQARLRNWNWK
jgi:hypothetical protein